METWALLIGVFFGVLVLARLLTAGAFSITKKPPVRIDHDWLVSREREERLKAAAIWRGYKR
jgi:hypothetical protein